MITKLVFIDDDRYELEEFRNVVGELYDYHPIQWPQNKTIENLIGEPPSIFVLDLYFPSKGDTNEKEFPNDVQQKHKEIAEEIAERFTHLYDHASDVKKLLRDTFSNIRAAYELLWKQCRVLKQSAEEGHKLLQILQSHEQYKDIPVVFYSRKITVEETVRALQAGVVDVIPKPDSPIKLESKELVLAKISNAIILYKKFLKPARKIGINLNFTLFKTDFSQQTVDMNLLKLGS